MTISGTRSRRSRSCRAWDLAYVERAPDSEETSLVEWNHETVTHEELAPSFAGFFDPFLQAFEAGEYEYDGRTLLHEDGASGTPGH